MSNDFSTSQTHNMIIQSSFVIILRYKNSNKNVLCDKTNIIGLDIDD